MTPGIRKLRTMAYLGRVWASGLTLQLGLRSTSDRMLRPRITGEVPPLSLNDVTDFCRATGGDPDLYRLPEGGLLVPPLYLATWAVPELARALLGARLPVNYMRTTHAACSVRITRLPTLDDRMRFTATVETVVRTGKAVRIEQQVVITSHDAKPLIEYAVAIAMPDRTNGSAKRPPELIPAHAHNLASLTLEADQGWNYALLSGDFTPIHWMTPYARLVGLPAPIAHGLDVMSRMADVAIVHLAEGQPRRLRFLEASFLKPIPLPACRQLLAGPPQKLSGNLDRVPLWLTAEPAGAADVTGHAEVER